MLKPWHKVRLKVSYSGLPELLEMTTEAWNDLPLRGKHVDPCPVVFFKTLKMQDRVLVCLSPAQFLLLTAHKKKL